MYVYRKYQVVRRHFTAGREGALCEGTVVVGFKWLRGLFKWLRGLFQPDTSSDLIVIRFDHRVWRNLEREHKLYIIHRVRGFLGAPGRTRYDKI
eukprot:COSAG02_NODE_12108_length_1594_cov_7.822074_2_plen_94_part_00